MTACEMVEASDRMRHYARETVFNMTRACLPDVAYHYARAAAHEAHCLLRWVDRAEQTEHDLLTLTVAAERLVFVMSRRELPRMCEEVQWGSFGKLTPVHASFLLTLRGILKKREMR